MFQLEHLTETAIDDGIEDGELGRANAGGDVLCEWVARREDDIDPDTALWSITVVLKLEPVSVQLLFGTGVVDCGSERGQSKTGSLEVHKGLKGSRRLGSL